MPTPSRPQYEIKAGSPPPPGRAPSPPSPSPQTCPTSTSTKSASTTPRGRRLVAAVEIVSPTDKDRPEHRRAFVAKCASLLQALASVAIVDLVTTRTSNLYGELLETLGQVDPSLAEGPPPFYAVACRWARRGDAWILETWSYHLTLGRPLPTLPLWLAADLAVPLEFEVSFEETCRVLRIP